MTESQIQAQIIEYLSLRGIYCHSVPNEGAGPNKLRTMRLIAQGMRPGVADLVVWFPWGRIGYLEVKTLSGRQSESQKRFQTRCEKEGIFYAVVRSVDEVEQLIHRESGKQGGR